MKYLLFALLLAPVSLLANTSAGEIVYNQTCVYCHGDAKMGTAIAPSIEGSPLILLQKKITQGKYPRGYLPKRETTEMPLFPTMSDESIIYLYMYLNRNINVTLGAEE